MFEYVSRAWSITSFIYFLKFYLFICFHFWLHWVFVGMLGLSLVVTSGSWELLSTAVHGFLVVMASPVEHRLQALRLP